MKERLIEEKRLFNLPILKNLSGLIDGITVYPWIFYRPECEYIILHERIHWEQERRLFVIGFFIAYAAQFVFYFCKYRELYKAYRAISFEVEAYNESQ